MITARFAGLEVMYYGGGQRGLCGQGSRALSPRKAYSEPRGEPAPRKGEIRDLRMKRMFLAHSNGQLYGKLS